MIRFHCQHCHRPLSAPEERADAESRCRGCGGRVRVPHSPPPPGGRHLPAGLKPWHLAAGGTVLLLLVATLLLPRVRSALWGPSSREAFERGVLGASEREVRWTLGAPDEVLPGRATPARAMTGAQYAQDLQSAGTGTGDRGYEWWTYRGRTLHPWDGRPDSLAIVQFEGGRVARVLYRDEQSSP